MKKEDMIRLFKEARDLELKNVEIARQQEQSFSNEAQKGAKLMVEVIRRDSAKHARIYEVLIEMLEQNQADYLWEYRMDKFVADAKAKQSFENHVKMEKAMLAQVNTLLGDVEHPGLKLMLQLIVNDEQIHHDLLDHIKERLYQLKNE